MGILNRCPLPPGPDVPLYLRNTVFGRTTPAFWKVVVLYVSIALNTPAQFAGCFTIGRTHPRPRLYGRGEVPLLLAPQYVPLARMALHVVLVPVPDLFSFLVGVAESSHARGAAYSEKILSS